MSGPARAGLLIFAKELPRLAHFYQAVLSLERIAVTPELVVLESSDMQLVVHAIPAPVAAGIVITIPPKSRADTALKFFFTVASIAGARVEAAALGGEVFMEKWHGRGFVACDACDPEGNVFQVREFTG